MGADGGVPPSGGECIRDGHFRRYCCIQTFRFTVAHTCRRAIGFGGRIGLRLSCGRYSQHNEEDNGGRKGSKKHCFHGASPPKEVHQNFFAMTISGFADSPQSRIGHLVS